MFRRSLIGALVAAPLARPAFSETAYAPLFDGRSLDGWDVLGDANWGVRDGVISADAGDFSFLVSKRSYRDFDLLAELWVSDDANSGIFIRCSNRRQVTAATAYEVAAGSQSLTVCVAQPGVSRFIAPSGGKADVERKARRVSAGCHGGNRSGPGFDEGLGGCASTGP